MARWRGHIQLIAEFAIAFPVLYCIFSTQPLLHAVPLALAAALFFFDARAMLGRALNRYDPVSPLL